MGTYRISELTERTGEPPAHRPSAVPVVLSRSREAADAEAEGWRGEPVACTLAGEEVGPRLAQWRDLLEQCRSRETVPDGLRLVFPATPELAGGIAALAAAEQRCCSFFDFTLHLGASSLVLTVRAPESAAGLLTELFGAVE